MKNLSLIIQIVSVISIASFAGSMLMLSTSLVPFWKQISPDDFLNWFSNYSSGIEATTGLMVKLSMLFPLFSIILTWKVPKSRIYWLISYAFIIGIMVVTMSFFIGANSSFVAGTIEANQVNETVHTWGSLHIIRTILGFTSALFAGIGLTKYFLNSTTSKRIVANDGTEQHLEDEKDRL